MGMSGLLLGVIPPAYETSPACTAVRHHDLLKAANPRGGVQYGQSIGPGFISGVLTVKGVPSPRRVRVLSRTTGRLVAQNFSAEDGSYRIDYLSMDDTYTVIGLDNLNEHNACVQDAITPVLMPGH